MTKREQELVYEGNPKHKLPWQRGRRGSLCPPEVDADRAKELLEGSEPHAGKRFATDGEMAYCAREHRPGSWHGYPVGWREVPASIRSRWLRAGRVSRTEIRTNW